MYLQCLPYQVNITTISKSSDEIISSYTECPGIGRGQRMVQSKINPQIRRIFLHFNNCVWESHCFSYNKTIFFKTKQKEKYFGSWLYYY